MGTHGSNGFDQDARRSGDDDPAHEDGTHVDPEHDEPRSGDAGRAPETGTGPDTGKQGRRSAGRTAFSWLREILTIIVIALLLSFLIKTFLFRPFYIPSGSMEDTLQIDDRIFVNELVPEPFALHRGDVVVFKDTQGWLEPVPPEQPGVGTWLKDAMTFIGLLPDASDQHLVKRLIGMPGDHVICCNPQGRIMVNGTPLNEPYLYPGAAPSNQQFDVVVPKGKIWVMGDHRNASADSRAHMDQPGHGFVDIDDVEGRAVVIAWPLDRIGILGNYPKVFDHAPDPAGVPAAHPDSAVLPDPADRPVPSLLPAATQ